MNASIAAARQRLAHAMGAGRSGASRLRLSAAVLQAHSVGCGIDASECSSSSCTWIEDSVHVQARVGCAPGWTGPCRGANSGISEWARGLGTSRSRRMASDESTGSGSRVEGAPGGGPCVPPAPRPSPTAAPRSCSIVARVGQLPDGWSRAQVELKGGGASARPRFVHASVAAWRAARAAPCAATLLPRAPPEPRSLALRVLP